MPRKTSADRQSDPSSRRCGKDHAVTVDPLGEHERPVPTMPPTGVRTKAWRRWQRAVQAEVGTGQLLRSNRTNRSGELHRVVIDDIDRLDLVAVLAVMGAEHVSERGVVLALVSEVVLVVKVVPAVEVELHRFSVEACRQ